MADRIFRAFVEHHHDVAAERQLDIDRGRGRELVRVAIQMRLESDAFIGDFAQAGEAEDLIAAGIRQNRTGPRHEAVQTTEVLDQLVAGAHEEMVGIGKNDAGLKFVEEIALVQAFHGGLGADRHEDRGGDVAVFGVQDAGAGPGNGAFGEEFEGDLPGQPRLYCARLVS